MGLPFARRLRSLQATGGQRNCFEVRCPSRGALHRLVITQPGGTLVPFRVDLFESRHPCQGASESSGGPDPAGNYQLDPDHYKVFATADSDSPGRLRRDWDAGLIYKNADGSLTNNEGALYLEITPEGSGAKAFDVTLVFSGVEPN